MGHRKMNTSGGHFPIMKKQKSDPNLVFNCVGCAKPSATIVCVECKKICDDAQRPMENNFSVQLQGFWPRALTSQLTVKPTPAGNITTTRANGKIYTYRDGNLIKVEMGRRNGMSG